MDSSHDYQWLDLGGSSNNLCKSDIIYFDGIKYSFNKEGLLSGSYILEDVDKIARYIAIKNNLPYIVIVRGGKTDEAGWYIKYCKHRVELNPSDKIKFCRVIERR
jgi:hypothetical protein